MKKMGPLSLVIVLVALLAMIQPEATRGRTVATPATAAERMKALAFLAGEWRGPGKMHRGPSDVVPFSIVESAAFVLDGTVMQIDGVATAVIDGRERVVGKGLGLIHYDAVAAVYRMRHYEASGETFETIVLVSGDSIAYESQDTAGLRLRVEVRIDAAGRWQERVDRFEAGAWRLFREYDLQRASSDSRPSE